MRIGSNNSSSINGYNVVSLYNEINCLSPLFENIILVNPIEQSIINVTQYGLDDKHVKCTSICPLINDKCGCVCKDTVSTGENRCRFV